jgi:hypothetical protein
MPGFSAKHGFSAAVSLPFAQAPSRFDEAALQKSEAAFQKLETPLSFHTEHLSPHFGEGRQFPESFCFIFLYSKPSKLWFFTLQDAGIKEI